MEELVREKMDNVWEWYSKRLNCHQECIILEKHCTTRLLEMLLSLWANGTLEVAFPFK